MLVGELWKYIFYEQWDQIGQFKKDRGNNLSL